LPLLFYWLLLQRVMLMAMLLSLLSLPTLTLIPMLLVLLDHLYLLDDLKSNGLIIKNEVLQGKEEQLPFISQQQKD
jgi:hypothetical protein